MSDPTRRFAGWTATSSRRIAAAERPGFCSSMATRTDSRSSVSRAVRRSSMCEISASITRPVRTSSRRPVSPLPPVRSLSVLPFSGGVSFGWRKLKVLPLDVRGAGRRNKIHVDDRGACRGSCATRVRLFRPARRAVDLLRPNHCDDHQRQRPQPGRGRLRVPRHRRDCTEGRPRIASDVPPNAGMVARSWAL
jgi:hypothetical protein